MVDEKVVIVKPKSKDVLLYKSFTGVNELGFGIFEIAVPENVNVEEYVSVLNNTGSFEYVDYNIYGEYALSVNDSEVSNQWYLNTINAYSAWNLTTGSSQIKVALLDSGVDAGHNDLSYGNDSYSHLNINDGYNYPHNTTYSAPVYYHGTMVAGILGAKTNNLIGIAGVSGGNHSSGISIIPYCVGDTIPQINYVISAISNAVGKGVKIINLSLYFWTPNSGLQNAINSAYNSGVTIVCASGNDNVSQLAYPACYSNTIAVGASNQSNGRRSVSNSQGSNYGSGLDLVAPGKDIYSTTLNNNYFTDSGTSYAAPQVAGVAALMLSVNPSLTPSKIRSKLRSTCTKPSGYSYTNGWNSEVGYGVLNAYAAVCAALSGDNIVGPKIISTSGSYYIQNLPSGVTVSWSLSDNHYNNGYNLLIPNQPSPNQCVIARDHNYDLVDATLTAKTKYNNIIVNSQTLAPLNAYAGFRGQYTSGNLSGNIPSSLYFNIKTNTTTTVTSANFYGATVTYSSSGATPTAWGFNSTNGILNFKAPAGSTPVVINVHDGCGNNYTLYAMPSSYSINVSNGESGITVTLVEDGDASKDFTPEESWTLEIINAATGQVMATQSSKNRSETISTVGWPKGIYIVKV